MTDTKYDLPEPVYAPRELALVAKVSPGLIRKEIREGRLRAFRLGGKLLRILREDAVSWLSAQPTQSASTSSDGSPLPPRASPEGNTAPSGARARSGVDTALRSVLSDQSAKGRPH